MDQVKDQQLQRYDCGLEEVKELIGYKFVKLTKFEDIVRARGANINRTSRDWRQLVASRPEIALLFCWDLKDPIQFLESPHVA